VDEMTIQFIGAISSAVTSLGILAGIITGIALLAPQRRHLRVEATVDVSSAELNQIQV
jgi:hypothetical protein